MQLCLDPARFNRVLIRPVHMRPTLTNILPRLAGVKDLTLIDTNLNYHNLKLHKQSSYLTTFSCTFGRYRYIRLSFGVVPTRDMFQRETEEMFHGLRNVFYIADDILIAGFDDLGRHHDETVDKVLEICRKGQPEIQQRQVPFQVYQHFFFGEVLSQDSSSPDPRKLKVLIDMPPSKCKNELQSFLDVICYLSKFLPATAKVCEPLRKLTSVKSECSWKGTY